MAIQKLFERYNKCIGAGGGYFEGDESFMRVRSIKVPIRKTSGNFLNDPRIYIYICIYIVSTYVIYVIYTHVHIYIYIYI